MKNTKVLVMSLVASAALVAMLGLAACGGGSASSSAASSSAASSSAASTTASTSGAVPSAASSSAAASVDTTGLVGYMGVSTANETYYLAMDSNMTEGILVIMNNSGQYLSFVGPMETQGNMVQITDKTTGDKFGFELTASSGEGDFILDAGSAGQIVVSQCSIDDVVTALAAIDTYGTAVN